MARGWGKSEEDLQAEKESARDERMAACPQLQLLVGPRGTLPGAP